MPMGQIPVLEIDGKQYYQSRAIGRFLAKKSNLYGSNDFEALEIDATVDSMDDLRQGKNIGAQQTRKTGQLCNYQNNIIHDTFASTRMMHEHMQIEGNLIVLCIKQLFEVNKSNIFRMILVYLYRSSRDVSQRKLCISVQIVRQLNFCSSVPLLLATRSCFQRET